MPPKGNEMLKGMGKSKAKAQDPQTENEFLDAADDFEQAAGKWRAGDAAKATRFFNRAIDMYNEGLKKFPGSFDLAYNKANLEFNICEDDRIVARFSSKMALLEETLKSHRVAMALKAENTDVMFNTGQVLTSIAEALLEAETEETAKVPARTLLEEAVDLFTKCLERQQQEYEQMRIEIAKAQAEQDLEDQLGAGQGLASGAKKYDEMETSSTASSTLGNWATVEEPLTPETILETCTAQLEALTTLLGLYDPTDLLLEARAQHGVDTTNKVPTLITLLDDSPFQKHAEAPSGPTLSISPSGTIAEDLQTAPKDDALLAVANFNVAVAEVAYRRGLSTSDQFARAMSDIFTPMTKPPGGQDPAYLNALSAYADALMDVASTISDNPSHNANSPAYAADLETQWAVLTEAQNILTKLSTGANASALPASRLADTFLARGDTDLFRFRLALLPVAKPPWASSKATLVGNAGVFYRGARSYAEKAGKADVHRTADAKAIVAEVLKEVVSSGGGIIVGNESWKVKGMEVKKVLEQMVEEGILGRDEAEGVLRIVQ